MDGLIGFLVGLGVSLLVAAGILGTQRRKKPTDAPQGVKKPEITYEPPPPPKPQTREEILETIDRLHDRALRIQAGDGPRSE